MQTSIRDCHTVMQVVKGYILRKLLQVIAHHMEIVGKPPKGHFIHAKCKSNRKN
jgi:hypothetical protein